MHIRLLARPAFTYIRDNDLFSDYSTQIALVRDRTTRNLVSVIRQGDNRFVDFDLFLPARYIDRRGDYHLQLIGSSAWDDAPKQVEVISAVPVDGDDFQTYEIAFGKPDDIHFLGDNISYAEGALPLRSSWFHNKFFRSANNPASFHVPLTPRSSGYITFNAYFSDKSRVTLNGQPLATFDRTLGTRFFQDLYRTSYRFDGSDAAMISLETVNPFRPVPVNMRQLAFAFNSVEVVTTKKTSKIDLIGALNARLDYRHTGGEVERLLRSDNPITDLLRYQGAPWLPDRAPTKATGKRHVDAVVLLDPVLQDLASVSYSTGDTWIESAVGAAMMLENAGYSVVYAFPGQLQQMRPSVVYIPSQPFYTTVLSKQMIEELLRSRAHLIIEPSLAETMLNNPDFADRFRFRFTDNVVYAGRDDAVVDGFPVNGATPTTVFGYTADQAYSPSASLFGAKTTIALNGTVDGSRISMFATPVGYYFYNYGLRAQQAMVKAALAFGGSRPAVTATSQSQIRAYAMNVDRCAFDVMIENDNVGAFNYYGFAKSYAPAPNGDYPPISKVELGGYLLDLAKNWTVTPPLASLKDLASDTFVHFSDKSCPIN
ncbi:hypothetical protein [Bradyrhizobium sp. USDA 4529]